VCTALDVKEAPSAVQRALHSTVVSWLRHGFVSQEMAPKNGTPAAGCGCGGRDTAMKSCLSSAVTPVSASAIACWDAPLALGVLL